VVTLNTDVGLRGALIAAGLTFGWKTLEKLKVYRGISD
jgi:hypothetical protein